MLQTIRTYNINKKGKQINYDNIDKGSVNFDGKTWLCKIKNQKGANDNTFRKNEIIVPQKINPLIMVIY